MRIALLISLLILSLLGQSQPLATRFETSNGTQTATYHEAISWWTNLDATSPIVKMLPMGPTDAGYPLHLVLISSDKDFHIPSLKNKNKNIIFILNGIHPGEPDGIDASMLLARDIAQGKYPLPCNVVLALIPIYNIGGALNRSAFYRVDQNGPEEVGFRGNSQNLDLNRDFIKCDSREALTFTRIFRMLDPDVLIDNHVSNGADYQHVMTLIASQHNRLGGSMGQFMNTRFEPGLYTLMKLKGYDLVPYVNHFGDTPDRGWPQFWDSPRYSSGYASLWNTFAFVPETHMLKPYKQRVASTKALIESFIEFTADNGKEIMDLRAEAYQKQRTQHSFPIAWKLDTSKFSSLIFKGYETTYKRSMVSGLPRLYYDRNKPYEKRIPFYDYYIDTLSVQKPIAYIIPQGWWKVIERLQANGVVMHQLSKDSTITVECYKIVSSQSATRPVEGHHPNGNVVITSSIASKTFLKGDYYIALNQSANRFLLETLEPMAEDSYFTWNFFDAILNQKEGFSAYVFEETAMKFILEHPEIKSQLNKQKENDSLFATSSRAQLNYIYKYSNYYEPSHLQYPVYRILK